MKLKGELILLFSLTSEQLSDVKYIIKKMGLRYKIIQKGEYSQSISYLCNNPDAVKTDEIYSGKDFEKAMIVLKNFDKKRLDEFFNTIKVICKTNDDIIKAVVTNINKYWSAEKLFNSIYSEHRVMTENNSKNIKN